MRLSDLIPFLSGGQKTPAHPRTVLLETTNACNLRCKSCHIWGEGVKRKREVGFISEAVSKKAIDELSRWDEKINVILHGAGEPLLHKDFVKILSYAASKENLSAGFLSNGSLLTREISAAILETNIAWIGFSVDGAQDDQFRKNRGTELGRVEAAIETFLSLRSGNRPSIFVNMVALPEIDSERFIERWIDKVDEVKISTYRPSGHRDFLKVAIKRVPCSLLNEMLVVTWNGKAVLCCEDIWADNVVGTFPDMSLFDIWHSASFDKMRGFHGKGDYAKVQICRECDGWSNIYSETELDERRSLRIVKTASQITYSRVSKTDRSK